MTTRRAASGGRTLIALFLRFALLLRPAHGLGDRAGAGVWGPVAPSVHARPDKRLSRAGLHYAWPDAVKAHHAGRAERHARANHHLASLETDEVWPRAALHSHRLHRVHALERHAHLSHALLHGHARDHAKAGDASAHLAAELANASHGHLLRDAWHSLPGTNLATSGRHLPGPTSR